eukprot:465673_1
MNEINNNNPPKLQIHSTNNNKFETEQKEEKQTDFNQFTEWLLENNKLKEYYSLFIDNDFDEWNIIKNITNDELKEREAMQQKMNEINNNNPPKLQIHSTNNNKFETEQKEEQQTDFNQFTEWLLENNKLKEYYSLFIDNDINEWNVIKNITNDELKEIGIKSLGNRKRILQKIKEIKGDIDDDDIKNDGNVVNNVLAFVLGISEYDSDTFKNLPGVPIDIKNYRQLWEEYGYDIYPNKSDKEWYNKTKWTEEDIFEFIEQGRELLISKYNKRQIIYESVIFIIACHGGNNIIYPSNFNSNNKDIKPIQIPEIHGMLSGSWRKAITKIPILFIFDCCRIDDGFNGRG